MPMQPGRYTLVVKGTVGGCGELERDHVVNFRGCLNSLPISFIDKPGGTAADYGRYLSVKIAPKPVWAPLKDIRGTLSNFEGDVYGTAGAATWQRKLIGEQFLDFKLKRAGSSRAATPSTSPERHGSRSNAATLSKSTSLQVQVALVGGARRCSCSLAAAQGSARRPRCADRRREGVAGKEVGRARPARARGSPAAPTVRPGLRRARRAGAAPTGVDAGPSPAVHLDRLAERRLRRAAIDQTLRRPRNRHAARSSASRPAPDGDGADGKMRIQFFHDDGVLQKPAEVGDDDVGDPLRRQRRRRQPQPAASVVKTNRIRATDDNRSSFHESMDTAPIGQHDPESIGSFTRLITTEPFNDTAAAQPPPTSFRLSWYWNFRNASSARCYVNGVFVTEAQ